MVPKPWDEGMPIVQVKVHVLAEPGERTRDLEHMRQRAFHRVLDVRYTDITGAGVEAFSAAQPKVRVVFVNNLVSSGKKSGKEKQ